VAELRFIEAERLDLKVWSRRVVLLEDESMIGRLIFF
jgi:hypothetical protein